MSRGRNAVRRGNKTLAWYICDKILDKNEGERETPSPTVRTQSAMDRKNSLESQSSQSGKSAGQNALEVVGEKRKRERRNGRHRNRKHCNGNIPSAATREEDISNDAQLRGSAAMNSEDKSVVKERKEDYWYYDPVSDGFYYEHNGSRGWRKRNPKIHGTPVQAPKAEVPEQKAIAIPSAVPTSKFFPSATAANVPNVKYYDAATDGYFYEMASVDGWRRRQPIAPASAPTTLSFGQHLTQPKAGGDHMRAVQGYAAAPEKPTESFPNSFDSTADRILSNAEVEEIIVSETPPSGVSGLGERKSGCTPATAMIFSSMLASQRSRLNGGSFGGEECPSSSSTISSDDHCTPPPANAQHIPTQRQTSGCYENFTNVGSFEEPYEFYWSDNEKTSSSTIGKTSSVSSMDDYASSAPQETSLQLMADMHAHQRPSSLKIPATKHAEVMSQYTREDTYVPGFDVDQFIADLPTMDHERILHNLSAIRTPLFDTHPSAVDISDSPLFTPIVPRENLWDRAVSTRAANMSAIKIDPNTYDSAAASLEQGLKETFRDIEKLWL